MTEKSTSPETQPRLVDLELINTLTDGCEVCGKPFNLGDQVVPACGNWEGVRYIHREDARFDAQRNVYMDRRC